MNNFSGYEMALAEAKDRLVQAQARAAEAEAKLPIAEAEIGRLKMLWNERVEHAEIAHLISKAATEYPEESLVQWMRAADLLQLAGYRKAQDETR